MRGVTAALDWTEHGLMLMSSVLRESVPFSQPCCRQLRSGRGRQADSITQFAVSGGVDPTQRDPRPDVPNYLVLNKFLIFIFKYHQSFSMLLVCLWFPTRGQGNRRITCQCPFMSRRWQNAGCFRNGAVCEQVR